MSVTFAEDSEVKIIKSCAFKGYSINFQIPKSLEIFEPASFIMKINHIRDANPLISVSKDNHLFASPDNKYLFSKSQKDLDHFDTLVYVTPDIEEANIPSNIKIIKKQALTNCKSLIFSDDSQIEIIEEPQSLTKVFIPNNLQSFGELFFSGIKEVIVSPTNKRYKYLDNKYLLKKSDINNDIYDELVWIRKDVVNVVIPNYIKKIYPNALDGRSSISFEDDSTIEIIGERAIPFSDFSLEKIVFPPSVKVIKNEAIGNAESLTSLIFLSEEITIESGGISMYSNNYCCLEFPNAKKIIFNCWIPEGYVIRARRSAVLRGSLFEEEHFKPQFYDDISVSKEKLDILFEYVRSLEKKLSEYIEINPFDLDSIVSDKIGSDKKVSNDNE